MEFLAIKNWDEYQSTETSQWIKDYVNKDFDRDFMNLSLAQKAMLDACCRLRARHGCNMPNDPLWICRAVAVRPQDRHNAVTAIRQLIDSGFLILTNQADNSLDKIREEEIRVEKNKPSARPARGRNSQAAKATGETRHTRVKQLVQGFYQDWAGAECPWDGSEAGNLDKLLKATPHWVDSQFVTCLENLARSDCIAPGARPRTWLGDLPKFLKGPLDQYKNPKAVTNGNSKAQRIQNESIDAIKIAINRIDGAGACDSQGRVSEPEHDARNGGIVLEGVLSNLPRSRATAAGVGGSGSNPRE